MTAPASHGSHTDLLAPLNRALPLNDKLRHTHRVLQVHYPFIGRISVALYDPKTEILKTYLHSSDRGDPLSHYQTPLRDAPSLFDVYRESRPRVINDMQVLANGRHAHTARLRQQDYAASYTLPMFSNGVFFGFLFFNSYNTNVFTDTVLHDLDLYARLISLMVINELGAARTLLAAVTTAAHLSQERDAETGGHLDRMSHYARLIADTLAPRFGLSDEYVEHVFMFSPLHDIGKIGIPDRILLKPGKLDAEEFELMKSHVRRGREMIDDLLQTFGLDAIQHIDILRNLVEFHHETIDGRGYLRGLKGEEIPLEARIVAVADIFDALTSQRPYKEAWSNDQAFATLRELAGTKLDADCVQALIDRRDEVEQTQDRFRQDLLG